MQDSVDYKVIDRWTFAVVMLVLLSVVAVVVWVSLDYFAEYVGRLEEQAATNPAEAAAAARKLMRSLALLNGLVLGSLAITVIWQGWSGRRLESMPLAGSWILKGQRTWTGESAVRISNFIIAAGVLLGALGIASSLILWSLGDTLVDGESRGARMQGHGTSEIVSGGLSSEPIQTPVVVPA